MLPDSGMCVWYLIDFISQAMAKQAIVVELMNDVEPELLANRPIYLIQRRRIYRVEIDDRD